MGLSLATAQRYVAAWFAAQTRPEVPRVTKARTKKRGRPGYEVDRESFERWLLTT